MQLQYTLSMTPEGIALSIFHHCYILGSHLCTLVIIFGSHNYHFRFLAPSSVVFSKLCGSFLQQ